MTDPSAVVGTGAQTAPGTGVQAAHTSVVEEELVIEGIGLVSQSASVSLREMARAACAIQTQVLRDVQPAWAVSAAVNPFFRLEDLPLGHWPVVLRDDPTPGIGGIHHFEGTPVAVADAGPGWTTALSRLVIELLVNPTGTRRMVGKGPMADHGEVELLVAPTAAAGPDFHYAIHRMEVSDFVFPAYYRSHHGPHSFGGVVDQPGQIRPGGCITWWDAMSGRWWRQQWADGGQPDIEALADEARHPDGPATRLVPPVPWFPDSVDLRASEGNRPSGATRRAQRISDHLLELSAFMGATTGDQD